MQTLYTLFLFPLMYLAFWLFSLKNQKIREGFELRKNKSWLKPYDAQTRWIWFHVASGEIEYAKPVIAKLKASFGENPAGSSAGPKILVTFFSPSVLPSLQKTKDIDLFVPMPWDTPWHWNEFLKHYHPRCVAIARTDTWPNMIWQVRKRGIPSLLFSATLPSTSARAASFFTRLFYGSVIDKLTHVSCVTEDDCANFRRLDDELSLSADGDTRFDQAISRIAEKRPLLSIVQNLGPTFVVGSSWREDENVLLPALAKPIAAGLNVILAPHEPTPDHLETLELQFAKMNIKTCRYSVAGSVAGTITAATTGEADAGTVNAPEEALTGSQGKVVLVDIIGVLADLYRVGTIAFVGGSFKKTVHSVMEPAAAGCLTLFGPYHFNNREALAMKAKNLATEISDSRDLEALLLNELELTKFTELMAKRTENILAFVNSNKGVSQKIASWILDHSKL